MAKTKLEKAIGEAAGAFALQIVEAIKSATLEELIALQGADVAAIAPKKRGRKPGPKPGAKRGRPPGRPPKKAKAKPGPKPKAAKAAVKKKPGPKPKAKPGLPPTVIKRKKRVVKNYPKCAYPSCDKNRFIRGKGFCGDHWRQWLSGKIKGAEEYQKK